MKRLSALRLAQMSITVRKLTHSELCKRQTLKAHNARVPIAVVLSDIRSLYNVGSIFRTADGAGVETIWLCGITGTPGPHQADRLRKERDFHRMKSRIAKTALDAHERVKWEYSPNAGSVIEAYRRAGYETVLLEQTSQSIPYQCFEPDKPVCLVLGSELSGIDGALVEMCDRAIEIDMSGVKNSLNVSVAFGIAVYHIRQAMLVISESRR